ncbi:MAG: helix-turn-helix transcriptional regulator [Oscillospiraceae bacterium]|nr:helix-turn-helix transcriptional regulator [Oscillospiraceae bacterium]
MNNIRELCRRSGIKQTELAKEMGTTQTSISEWGSGRKSLSIENAIALARIFGVTVGCLVGTEPIPEDYGTAAGSSAPAPNQPAAKKAPAAQQGQAAPFSQEQLRYLDAWRKDLAREVADLIQEDISSSSGQAGGA